MRLDKWLKVSRLIKRRTVANEACDNARVTANGRPVKASYDVKAGDVLELRFCEDMQWKQVAFALNVTDRQARADADGALEWVDLVGLAAARDGMGQAALF